MSSCVSDPPPAWPAAAILLDAISRRDFEALQGCLDVEVRLRALVPSGPVVLDGADAVAAKFRAWFGGHDEFEIVDASLGQLGSRVYARWRVRMWPADQPAQSRIAEQHVFTCGTDRISAVDLLCSGFQPGRAA